MENMLTGPCGRCQSLKSFDVPLEFSNRKCVSDGHPEPQLGSITNMSSISYLGNMHCTQPLVHPAVCHCKMCPGPLMMQPSNFLDALCGCFNRDHKFADHCIVALFLYLCHNRGPQECACPTPKAAVHHPSTAAGTPAATAAAGTPAAATAAARGNAPCQQQAPTMELWSTEQGCCPGSSQRGSRCQPRSAEHCPGQQQRWQQCRCRQHCAVPATPVAGQ